jgi:hypothetical protein
MSLFHRSGLFMLTGINPTLFMGHLHEMIPTKASTHHKAKVVNTKKTTSRKLDSLLVDLL